MTGKKNAVEKRLELLHDQWTEFAQLPEARLLRWVVEPDEVRMVDAFLHKEGDARIGECPDLFLLFHVPFDEPDRYGAALHQALVAQVEESRAGLEAEEGLAPGVTCPPATPGAEVASFLEACGWLRGHFESVCEHLAVVLMPSRVVEAKAWLTWLRSAVEQAESPHVRLVVLDDARTLGLEPLAELLPDKVVTIPAKLNMSGALEELSQEAGHLDTPGGRFRDLFVHMGNAATKGAVSEVARLGAKAVALATEQGWFSLAVTAHFVMGGTLLAVKQPREALGHYQKAEAAAGEAEGRGEVAGAELRLKSRLAQGTALVSALDYSVAATLYEETAPLARKLGDARMELECWRMASWCCELVKEVEQAWTHGQRAWEVGQAMDAATRETSTLPYVGEALVRLSQARQGVPSARDVESEVEAVLGADWRPKAAGGQAA